jgi:hypothetical protein
VTVWFGLHWPQRNDKGIVSISRLILFDALFIFILNSITSILILVTYKSAKVADQKKIEKKAKKSLLIRKTAVLLLLVISPIKAIFSPFLGLKH